MKGPGVTREVLIHSGPSNALLGEIGRVVPKSSMSSWYGFSVLDCYHRQIGSYDRETTGGLGVNENVYVLKNSAGAIEGRITKTEYATVAFAFADASGQVWARAHFSSLQSMVSPRWHVTNVRASLTLLQKLALLGVLSLKTDHDQQP